MAISVKANSLSCHTSLISTPKGSTRFHNFLRISLSCHTSLIYAPKDSTRFYNSLRIMIVSTHICRKRQNTLVRTNRPIDKSQKQIERFPIIHHCNGIWRCSNPHKVTTRTPQYTMLSRFFNSQ